MVLRLAVVTLAVVLLGALGALGALALRPGWFAGLRAVDAVASAPPATRATSAAPAAAPGTTPPATATIVTPPFRPRAPARLHLVVATPTAATYAVPTGRYTLAFVVDQPCWMALRTPPSSPEPTFSATLVPGRPTAITVRGPSSVMVAARSEAIEVRAGGRLVGSIEAPVVGLTYRFEPSQP